MKRMLINATQPEELRVALVDGQYLYNLDIETPAREQKKSNIYKGKITRVEPSLEAAFIDYGADRHGFLPLKEISPSLYQNPPAEGKRVEIKDVLKEGQEIIVQVGKEERGNKGAALTTFISLAGRYLVLMPNNPRAGGISRRIEGDDRNDLRDAISKMNIPDGMGMIIRTAGVGKNVEELQWDLDYLVQLWNAIDKASSEQAVPFLIYQESDIIIRAIRDYLRPDIGEILIDDTKVFEKACDFMSHVMPQYLSKIKLYQDDIPLFTRYQIENQIEAAYQHEIRLPSGGSVVIDHTEALVSIDINSSRATKGSDIEETALNTNLEAADEIARQMRLRDIGGLIVIDFIDMNPAKNQREVESRLKEALKNDRARIQVGRISRFGLLEMSRQRLQPSLGESTQDICPRCNGMGVVRGVESLALSILRLIEEDAMKENTAQVLVQLPVKVATYLLNEKRDAVGEIETRQKVRVLLVANSTLETPNYDVKRLRSDEASTTEGSSYKLATDFSSSADLIVASSTEKPKAQEPAVQSIVPGAPAPTKTGTATQTAENGGFIKQLWSNLFGATSEESKTEQTETKPAASPERKKTNNNRNRSGQSSRGGRGRRSAQSGNRKQASGQQKTESSSTATAAATATADENQQQGNQAKENQNKDTQPRQRRPRQKKTVETESETQTAATNEAVVTEQTQTEQDGTTENKETRSTGRRRSRGRRGGRGRSRRNNQQNTEQNPQSGNEGQAGSQGNVQANASTTNAPTADNIGNVAEVVKQPHANQSNAGHAEKTSNNTTVQSKAQSKKPAQAPVANNPKTTSVSAPAQVNTAAPSQPAPAAPVVAKPVPAAANSTASNDAKPSPTPGAKPATTEPQKKQQTDLDLG